MVAMAQPVKINKEHLKFIGLDSWSRPTYLYKDKIYLKQINFKEVKLNTPITLCDTADNTLDCEPNNLYNIIMIE